jgi:hypothetical protein
MWGGGEWTVLALRACVSVVIIICLIDTVKYKLVQCFARPSDKCIPGGWLGKCRFLKPEQIGSHALSTFERFTSLAGLISPLIEHIFLPFLNFSPTGQNLPCSMAGGGSAPQYQCVLMFCLSANLLEAEAS